MDDAEYRKLAEVEDRMWYFQGLHALIESELVEGFRRQPGRCGVPEGAMPQLLDAGCGAGGLIRRMAVAHPGWVWTGVDASAIACAFARERTSATIVEGRLERLPFADAVFDAVVCADVLYHLDDDAAALAELHRVLRPGGKLLVNVPAYAWLWSYHDVAVHGRRRYSRGEVVAKMVAAGIGPVHATYWNTLFFPLIAARRKLAAAPAGGSDVRLYPPPVEWLGRTALALERAWLSAAPLPFGSSIFAVGTRRAP